MTKSPHRDLRVFDFKEDFNHHPIAAYDFCAPDAQVNKVGLKNVASIPDCTCDVLTDAQVNKVGLKNVASIPCVDLVDDICNLEKGCSDRSRDTVEDMFDSQEKNSELERAKPSNSSSHENHHFIIDIHNYIEPGEKDTCGSESSPEMSQIEPSGSPYNNGLVGVNIEDGKCMNESASTSPASDIAENVSLNGCGLNGTDNSDMDNTNLEVVLHPDYVIYQNNYYMGPKLTFSDCCMKINVSTSCIKQGAFDLEWAVDDLIDIKCQLFQRSGVVIIKLRVISSNTNQLNHTSNTSGIEELEIVVVESNWSQKHKQITSLNVKYLAIWNVVLNADVEGHETNSRRLRCYFPKFENPFDEVVYPKGDPDAVSLSKRDVDLLQPDTFINDTIIDFYIQYLKNQIPEEDKLRYHFFNSFFFRKLADMDKNPSSASDGKAAFLRVRKWTRKVKLFEKDYVFIPVNFNLHWSLIVICHPGEVINFNDAGVDKSIKVPCILHMDSIKGTHSGLKNLVQSYLWEEWKERHKDTLEEDLSEKFFNMRFLPLALPQQENCYDCGLFLLHYLELFLAEAPLNFNPFKVTKFSNFLNVDWFLPAEAYLKRTLIQRLILELVEKGGLHEISSFGCSEDHGYLENNGNGTSIEHPAPAVNRESITSHAEEGIEITLLSGSSSLDPQSFNNSGLVLKELFVPGATEGITLAQCQSFDQHSTDFRFNGSVISVEDDTDIGEQLLYLSANPNFQQVAGITPRTCSLPYSRDCGDESCHRPEIPMQAEREMAELSLDAANGASDGSEDIRVTKITPVPNEPGSSNEAELGVKICSPSENPELCIDIPTPPTGISQGSITRCDGDKNKDLHSSCHETPTTPFTEVSQDSIIECDGNKNEDLHHSCHERPTMSLPEVSQDPIVECDGDMNEDLNPSCHKTPTIPLPDVSADSITKCDGNKKDLHTNCHETPTVSLPEVSQDSITKCAGNNNEDLHSSCHEIPTIPLPEVSDADAVDDKVTCDDGEMIDDRGHDVCEEQVAKRRRLMPQQCITDEIMTDSNL